MTSSLPTRAATLRSKLNTLKENGSRVSEAAALEDLRLELSKCVAPYDRAMEKIELLRAADVPVAIPPSVANAKKRVIAITGRFAATANAETLKKGQDWPKLLAEITAATNDLQAVAVTAWKQRRSKFFAGDTPAALDAMLAHTSENVQALKAYNAVYKQFTDLFVAPPPDTNTIERTTDLAAQLAAISTRFDFAVPTEVKVFIDAVQSIGGARLSHLTPAVLQWLRDNGSLEAYRIKAATE